MKIAVTYQDGMVFPHFGKTEQFKVYTIEEDGAVSAEVIGTDGTGHEALAGFLAQKGIDTVICGGLGDGAQAALAEAGIEVISGAEGDADSAVASYLAGQLESAGVNCDHHHGDEEEGCGGCGGGCGGCGGGCGGCGEPEFLFEGKNVGKTCRVHYLGTFNDGTKFDSSYDRGQPLEFICGAGMMIPGFDKAVAEMEVGQILDIHLMPEEAYGPTDPSAILKFEIARLPGSEKLSIGDQVALYDNMGRQIPVKVIAKDETEITLDANHEMAGKELNFRVELVSIE